MSLIILSPLKKLEKTTGKLMTKILTL